MTRRLYICDRCREGVVKDDGDGWGECVVCGQQHDMACLIPWEQVRR